MSYHLKLVKALSYYGPVNERFHLAALDHFLDLLP